MVLSALPQALIGRLLSVVIRHCATTTLVVSLWPSWLWWPDLHLLRVDEPLILPAAPTTLRAVGVNLFSGFQHPALAYWRTLGAPSKIAAYLTQ